MNPEDGDVLPEIWLMGETSAQSPNGNHHIKL
jgi:hypothetical protein